MPKEDSVDGEDRVKFQSASHVLHGSWGLVEMAVYAMGILCFLYFPSAMYIVEDSVCHAA